MAFWSAYAASKRPPEVEELCDYIMRPLGYLVAKAAMPTPVTPNAITVLSMVFSIAAASVWLTPFPRHVLAGAVLLFVGATMDAADGQLARMRRSQSAHGRMLDGVADGVCAFVAVGGGAWLLWSKFAGDVRLGLAMVVAALLTAYTGAQHTSMYDHYKNVWLRLTNDKIVEGEDLASAEARRAEQRDLSLLMRATWWFYVGYVKSQEALIRRFDPFTTPSVTRLPPFDPTRGATYRRHVDRIMPLWKPFGFGTVIVGIALFAAFDALEYYLALRLLVLHPVFLFWLRPLQRRASREAFAEMGIAPGEPTVVPAAS
jgi:hypothetical protein